MAPGRRVPAWASEKSPLWKQAIVRVLDGRGAGQWRAVTAHAGKAWEIDRPWDCAPDKDSWVTIVPFNGRALVIGNRFEDADGVDAGYGTSIDVIYAGNRLVHGLVMKRGCFPSWCVQYLDNEISEGHTTIDTTGSSRDNEQYTGPITRGVIHRRHRLSKDNSGGISVSGRARDVIVEGCVRGHPMGTIRAEGEAGGSSSAGTSSRGAGLDTRASASTPP
jgi:hypothetical protein